MSWSAYEHPTTCNAKAKSDVPYYDFPEMGGMDNQRKGMLYPGEWLNVDDCGGENDCFLHLEGKGWVPSGYVIWTNDVAKQQFHPKERKGL